MIFDTATITEDGFRILTQAAAGERILWGTCMCAIDADGTQPVAKGSAVSVYKSATTDVAHITCSMDNTKDGCVEGMANYFLLYARKDGDLEDEVLAVRASVGDHTPTQFPAYDPLNPEGTSLRGIVDFSIQLSQGVLSSIDMTIASYALATDLQKLSERVVTSHVIDDDESGEAQDIYGEKTFKDTVRFDGENLISENQSASFVVGNEQSGFCNVRMNDGKISVSSDGLEIDCETDIYNKRTVIHSGDSLNNSGVHLSDEIGYAYIYSHMDDDDSSITLCEGGVVIECTNKCIVHPTIESENVFVKNSLEVFTENNDLVMAVSSGGILLDGNIEFSGDLRSMSSNYNSIGSSQSRFKDIYVGSVYCDVVNCSTLLRVEAIEANTIRGVAQSIQNSIPSVNYISVGSICFIMIAPTTSTHNGMPSKRAGDIITKSDIGSGLAVYIGKATYGRNGAGTGENPTFELCAATDSRQMSISDSMKLACLVDFEGISSNSSAHAIIPVMRIA